MDYGMLYALIIVFAVCVLTYFVSKLRKNNIVSSEDLLFVQNLFSLTIAVIDELNIKNEEKILQISNVVVLALEYATSVALGSEDVTKLALEKCYQLCEQMGIELSESRKLILSQLVNMGLMSRYQEVQRGYYVLAK